MGLIRRTLDAIVLSRRLPIHWKDALHDVYTCIRFSDTLRSFKKSKVGRVLAWPFQRLYNFASDSGWRSHYPRDSPERECRAARAWRRYQYTHRRSLSQETTHRRILLRRKNKFNNEQVSFFSKLPLEIRLQIYEEFFFDEFLDIRRFPKYLSRWVETFPTTSLSHAAFRARHPFMSGRRDEAPQRVGFLNLPLVCRQMYHPIRREIT